MGISVTIASSEEEREERQKGGEGSHPLSGEGNSLLVVVFRCLFSLPLHLLQVLFICFPLYVVVVGGGEEVQMCSNK